MKYMYAFLLIALSSGALASEVELERLELSVSEDALEDCKEASLADTKGDDSFLCKVPVPAGYISLGSDELDEISIKYQSFFETGSPYELEDAWIEVNVKSTGSGIEVFLQTQSKYMGGPYKQFADQSKINAFDQLKKDLSGVKVTFILVKK